MSRELFRNGTRYVGTVGSALRGAEVQLTEVGGAVGYPSGQIDKLAAMRRTIENGIKQQKGWPFHFTCGLGVKVTQYLCRDEYGRKQGTMVLNGGNSPLVLDVRSPFGDGLQVLEPYTGCFYPISHKVTAGDAETHRLLKTTEYLNQPTVRRDPGVKVALEKARIAQQQEAEALKKISQDLQKSKNASDRAYARIIKQLEMTGAKSSYNLVQFSDVQKAISEFVASRQKDEKPHLLISNGEFDADTRRGMLTGFLEEARSKKLPLLIKRAIGNSFLYPNIENLLKSTFGEEGNNKVRWTAYIVTKDCGLLDTSGKSEIRVKEGDVILISPETKEVRFDNPGAVKKCCSLPNHKIKDPSLALGLQAGFPAVEM